MEKHSIPVAQLLFPILLPLGGGVLFEQFVGGNNQQRGSRFKAHTALNADNGVAQIDVAPDAEGCHQFFEVLNGFHFVGVGHIVDGGNLALLKIDGDAFFARFGHLTQIGAFGQILVAMQGLFSANAGAPQPFVVAVFQFFEVAFKAVVFQIIDFVFAGECQIAGGGNHLNFRCKHLEGEVEANLVVAGTGRTVCYGMCSYLIGIARYGYGLEYTLRRY